MENNELKKEMTKEEKLDAMQAEIFGNILEVKDLLPELGHGEAKRLLIATLSYPYADEDFSLEQNQSLIQAYGACKRVKDAMIAVGVEVTLETMVQQAIANGDIQNPEETTTEGETNEEK